MADPQMELEGSAESFERGLKITPFSSDEINPNVPLIYFSF
jgi:hypothetical protein